MSKEENSQEDIEIITEHQLVLANFVALRRGGF
jgi:hypothetical protein